MNSLIPKLIHQTFPTRRLPPRLAALSNDLISNNYDWCYTLYDDNDIIDFIADEYGSGVLKLYNKICPLYGAARADLFRYLVMYKRGGVYLDIKSTCLRPLNEVLTFNEGYILSKWRNSHGEDFESYGLYPELALCPRGEFQQWFMICEAGHPFLEAVIENVLARVMAYRVWKGGVGRSGVIRLTGPVPYTLAIEPIKNRYTHKELVSHDEIDLRYNGLKDFDHRDLFKTHYTNLDTSIVRPNKLIWLPTQAYVAARRLKLEFIS